MIRYEVQTRPEHDWVTVDSCSVLSSAKLRRKILVRDGWLKLRVRILKITTTVIR